MLIEMRLLTTTQHHSSFESIVVSAGHTFHINTWFSSKLRAVSIQMLWKLKVVNNDFCYIATLACNYNIWSKLSDIFSKPCSMMQQDFRNLSLIFSLTCLNTTHCINHTYMRSLLLLLSKITGNVVVKVVCYYKFIMLWKILAQRNELDNRLKSPSMCLN